MTDAEFEKLLGTPLRIPAIVAEAERARASEKALIEALDMADEYMSEHTVPTLDDRGAFRVVAIRVVRAALAKARGTVCTCTHGESQHRGLNGGLHCRVKFCRCVEFSEKQS